MRLRSEHLDYDERFFEKHGDKTVFLGRFVALLRAWAAFLAGTNRMRWPKFLFFNAAGGILWAIVFGLLGSFVGNNLPLLHKVVDVLGIGVVVLAVIVVTVAVVVWRRRRSSHERSKEATPSPDRDGRSS